MNFRDYINVTDYEKQITHSIYKPLSILTWNTIQDEGIDEEWEVSRNDLEEIILNIPQSDTDGLKQFKDDVVNRYNVFDIWLKEKFQYHVDFIDYDNGVVKIIRKKNATTEHY